VTEGPRCSLRSRKVVPSYSVHLVFIIRIYFIQKMADYLYSEQSLDVFDLTMQYMLHACYIYGAGVQ